MKNYKELINSKKIPQHIGIIMDGNGRWANKKALPRKEGHRQGSETVEPIVEAAAELGVKAISLYAFSTENWVRPSSEITGLWKLLEEFFTTKIDKIHSNGYRVTLSGSLAKLPASTKKAIHNAIKRTRNNKVITLNFCLNYGGRQEIVHAVNTWLEKRKDQEKISVKKIDKYLYTSNMPDLDLMIRTSGEFRISNFLLWQTAYAELVFLDVLWPDFKPYHLHKSIYLFQSRKRRYGGI